MAERTLSVKIVGDERDLIRAFRSSDKAAQGFGGQISGLGAKLSRSLTPAAAAVAAAGAAAFRDWDAGLDGLRVATGATGAKLKEFENIMKTVGSQSTQSLAEVGATIGQLNQRLDLTGKPLAEISKRFLELDRLNMPATVENVTRVFGDWSVKTRNQSAVMDELFRASQGTGVSIDSLASSVVRFGAPLRQMGFGLAEATALVGKFEKEGVNTELVMGSMRIALGRLAKAGTDPVAGFTKTIEAIERTGSVADANRKAIELFGARAGPDMAAAIREGRFEIDALFKQVTKGSDSIKQAAKDTLDLGDRMEMFRNRVVAATGPYGEFIGVIGGSLAALGPAMFAIGQMVPLLGKLGTTAAGTTTKIRLLQSAMLGLGAIGVITISIVFLTNYDEIQSKFTNLLRLGPKALSKEPIERLEQLREKLAKTAFAYGQNSEEAKKFRDQIAELNKQLGLNPPAASLHEERPTGERSKPDATKRKAEAVAAAVAPIAAGAEAKTAATKRAIASGQRDNAALIAAEKREQQALKLSRQRAARISSQFEALGLTADGQQRVPGVGALRGRLANLREQLKGTALDTDKTRSQLQRIAKVLVGEYGNVGRNVRSAIQQMQNDIADAFKEGSDQKGPLTAFRVANFSDIAKQFPSLSEDELKNLRRQLGRTGIGGTMPRSTTTGGAFGFEVGRGGGMTIHIHGDVVTPDSDKFIRDLEKRARRGSGSRTGPGATQRTM